jgi:hypothetical protein
MLPITEVRNCRLVQKTLKCALHEMFYTLLSVVLLPNSSLVSLFV